MSIEVERKFLVREVPADLSGYPKWKIQQGYLLFSTEASEVRLRKKGTQYFQTFKSGRGLLRKEIEIELTAEQFERLWPATMGKRIEKERYEIEYETVIIELDVFQGHLQNLVVAEVEFDSIEESRSFKPPDWFGQEVTNDIQYTNRNLAR